MTSIRTCALAMAAVFCIGSQASAQQGGPAVTVVNTPLPVTVTNPTVPPSTVNVGNPADLAAANARALGVGTPVAFQLIAQGGGNGQSFTVPQGLRLVIEYVSGLCTTQPVTINPDIFAVTGGSLGQHTIAIPVGPQVQPSVALGQLVKIYADPGTNVTVNLATPQTSSLCRLGFSGKLVTP
jgi:hypothetical protein